MANQNTSSITPRGNDILSTSVKPAVTISPILSTSASPSASPSVSQSINKVSSKVASSPQSPQLTSSLKSSSQSSPSPQLTSSLKSSSQSPQLTSSPSSQSKPSILKYALLFIFLIFLILTLVLYLIKPESTKIIDIYAPIITFFSKKTDTSRKDKLESVINDKKIQSSDNPDKAEQSNTNKLEPASSSKEDVKDGEEVITLTPVSNDTDDPIQSNSKTKSGSCYIGTDKGFRNCVSVGEGDKCMSGDIFPTLEMCINPKLRE